MGVSKIYQSLASDIDVFLFMYSASLNIVRQMCGGFYFIIWKYILVKSKIKLFWLFVLTGHSYIRVAQFG